MKHFDKAFTIVELLIVITVIGILSSVSYVGYKDITGRAKATSYSAAADAAEKSIAINYAFTKIFPVGGGYFTGTSNWDTTCLANSASVFPATSEFPAGVCMIAVGTIDGGAEQTLESNSYSDDFINQFPESTRKDFPKTALPTAYFRMKSGPYDIVYKSRGISYNGEYHSASNGIPNGPLYGVLRWVSPYNENCGRGVDGVVGNNREAMQSAVNDATEQLKRDDLTEEERAMYTEIVASYSSILDSKSAICSQMFSPDGGTDKW